MESISYSLHQQQQKILVDIADASVQVCRAASSTTGVKRDLFFTETTPNTKPKSKINAASDVDQAPTKESVVGVHPNDSTSKKKQVYD